MSSRAVCAHGYTSSSWCSQCMGLTPGPLGQQVRESEPPTKKRKYKIVNRRGSTSGGTPVAFASIPLPINDAGDPITTGVYEALNKYWDGLMMPLDNYVVPRVYDTNNPKQFCGDLLHYNFYFAVKSLISFVSKTRSASDVGEAFLGVDSLLSGMLTRVLASRQPDEKAFNPKTFFDVAASTNDLARSNLFWVDKSDEYYNTFRKNLVMKLGSGNTPILSHLFLARYPGKCTYCQRHVVPGKSWLAAMSVSDDKNYKNICSECAITYLATSMGYGVIPIDDSNKSSGHVRSFTLLSGLVRSFTLLSGLLMWPGSLLVDTHMHEMRFHLFSKYMLGLPLSFVSNPGSV